MISSGYYRIGRFIRFEFVSIGKVSKMSGKLPPRCPYCGTNKVPGNSTCKTKTCKQRQAAEQRKRMLMLNRGK